MATTAQIQANRLNSQKSTGPRTTAGKEKASQNALKHGLLAQEAVIQGEDPAEFAIYREGMLRTLAPAGAVEAMLAERVVGLSWRLLRAERLQNAAFASLEEGEPTAVLEERFEDWKQVKGSDWDRSVCGVVDVNAELGRLVVEDFAGARVLDRLLMYERRIESSLYRTMAELRKEREARTAAEPKEISRSADQEPATPAELASFGAEPRPEAVSTSNCQVSSAEGQASGDGSDFPLPTSHFELPRSHFRLEEKITPCGVTTNPPTAGLDRHRERQAAGESGETNPIPGGVSSFK